MLRQKKIKLVEPDIFSTTFWKKKKQFLDLWTLLLDLCCLWTLTLQAGVFVWECVWMEQMAGGQDDKIKDEPRLWDVHRTVPLPFSLFVSLSLSLSLPASELRSKNNSHDCLLDVSVSQPRLCIVYSLLSRVYSSSVNTLHYSFCE